MLACESVGWKRGIRPSFTGIAEVLIKMRKYGQHSGFTFLRSTILAANHSGSSDRKWRRYFLSYWIEIIRAMSARSSSQTL